MWGRRGTRLYESVSASEQEQAKNCSIGFSDEGDFPRGPAAKTLHSPCRGPGGIPGQGARAPMPN